MVKEKIKVMVSFEDKDFKIVISTEKQNTLYINK